MSVGSQVAIIKLLKEGEECLLASPVVQVSGSGQRKREVMDNDTIDCSWS